jgi:NTE family protein
MPEKVIVDKPFLIRQTSIFSDLPPYEIEFISKRCEFFEYKKGEIIYNEGDKPDAFYLMISGRIMIFAKKPDGGMRNLECLSRGAYFGIISLLTNEPHSVTAQAVNDSLIAKIEAQNFHAILRTQPQLGVHFSAVLARRLRKKEVGRKTVFESTIISVYGMKKGIGCTRYAFNLAKALFKETKKKVVFLDMSSSTPPILELMPVFFDEAKVKNCIVKDPSGVSILRLSRAANAAPGIPQMSSLLTYLAAIFEYCVVDIPAGDNQTALIVSGQSDMVHVIADNDKVNIDYLNGFTCEVKKVVREPEKNIRVIISELNGKLDDYSAIDHGVYATLADARDNGQEYLAAVRRIAREMGEVLVGVALGSGGAWGLSLIGVIKVLEREHIPVDVIAASSMGALIGAFWAVGNSGADMERIAVENKKRFREFSFKDLKFPIRGLISDFKTLWFLRKYLGNKTFYDIKYPLKIVATGLEDRREVILDSGDIVDAVRTSISIPGIYSPVKYKDGFLIDGGILNPVPVSVLLKMNVKKIIAVNTLPSPADIEKGLDIYRKRQAKDEEEARNKKFFGRIFFKLKKRLVRFLRPNILQIITSSIEALEYSTAEANCRQADIVIHPCMAGLSWRDFVNPEALVALGEEAAEKALPEIKRLILED